MARQKRQTVAGGIYHVASRGNRRQAIAKRDDDRSRLLWGAEDVARRFGWHLHSWCLMTNHYHLLVETPDDNLSDGMHRLNGLYAQWFNDVHSVDGHLFQGRFRSVLVQREEHYLELCRYIALNPVRAGLCVCPEDWRWSSYGATVGAALRPRFLAADRLLVHFGDDPRSAQTAFAAFVRSGAIATTLGMAA